MKVFKLTEKIGPPFWCRSHSHKTHCRSDQRPQRDCQYTAQCSSRFRSDAPIMDALLSQKQREVAPFHIPGHKRGAGVLEDFQRIVSREILQYDLTELPGLDNLADPSGPIAESQELAADVFGADKTWYLVNGTSVGLQAAVMATCRPGDALIIARNCHVSAFAAMALADARPVWVAPEHDSESDVAQGINSTALEDAFARSRDSGLFPRAALVVSPTYFGACSDISGLAEICHRHKVPLIVDAAHGSHLGLQPGFPASALQSGADVVVQSTHKTLSSLGQSSMLHCKGGLVPHLRISEALRLLQTTSPSYLLLASLDASQAQARKLTLEGLPLPLEAVAAAKTALKALPGISLLEDSSSDCSVAAYDPWRITVNVRQLGRTGFAAETELQDQHSVYAEMATHKVVVFALGTGTTQQHLHSLVAGMTALCKTDAMEVRDEALLPLQLPKAAEMSPRQAFFADKEMIDFHAAAGRISGNIICPYPPGVPVVFPGEKLTKETLDFLKSVLVWEGVVTGAADRSLQRLLVVKPEA